MVFRRVHFRSSGSFLLAATSADPESGIQKLAFPSLAGFGSGGGDDTSSPYQSSYSWSGAGASASGSQSVASYDNAGLASSAAFTVSPDTSAPSMPAPTVSTGYVTTLSVPVSLGAAS